MVLSALGIGTGLKVYEVRHPEKARRSSLRENHGYQSSLRELYGWCKQVVSERLRCKESGCRSETTACGLQLDSETVAQ